MMMIVALRKESVDRNMTKKIAGQTGRVALRKESVDRNLFGFWYFAGWYKSLSARRAWIEIFRKEIKPVKPLCRSPQGERG